MTLHENFIENKYYNTYFKIINRSKQQAPEIYEKHHIIPKCLGGTNKTENIVKLSLREHYICHLLLTKFTKGAAKRRMHWALHRMAFSGKNYSKTYELCRKQHREIAAQSHKLRDKDKHAFSVKQNWESLSEAERFDKINGIRNFWKNLSQEEKLQRVLTGSKAALTKTVKYFYQVISPTGEIFDVNLGLGNFAKTNNLDAGQLLKVSQGKLPSYNGWKCYLKDDKNTPIIPEPFIRKKPGPKPKSK